MTQEKLNGGDAIFEEFSSIGLKHRQMLLLPAPAALAFVRECRIRGLDLLGFDGFTLMPNDMIQPHLDHMLDLSAQRYSHLSQLEKLALAESFIEERLNSHLFFEMVIG